MKILVFYVDKQYFNMVILLLRLRVRRELIIRRDGRAVEGTGLENRRCESIRGFESHSLRQLNFSIDLRKYPRGRRGSPAKGVGRVKSAAEVQILSSAPSKNLEAIRLNSDKVLFSFARGRERCDRNGHAVFLRPRVDFATTGSEITGISTSSTKLK